MSLRRNLFLLFSANTVSNFASGITVLAIPWYLVNLPAEENGSQKIFWMMVIVTLVAMIWGVFAGSLVDKFNRKRIFQVLQTVTAILLCSIGIWGYLYGSIPFALIVIAKGATLCTWTLFYPNLYAFCQELVPKKYYKQVNSGIELQGQITTLLGMLIGPVLMTGRLEISFLDFLYEFHKWQLYELILLDGGTYLLSVMIISLIRYTPGAYIHQAAGKSLDRIKNGFRYVRERPALMVFGLASFMIFMVFLVFMQGVMAIYIGNYLNYPFDAGAPVIAGFKALYSVGAIFTGLLGLSLARAMANTNLISQVIGLLFLSAILFGLLTFTHSASVLFICGFLIGIANSGARILRITYLVRIVPNHMIGRVNTFFTAINALMRLTFFLVLTIPFFSLDPLGNNILYATGAMALISLLSGCIMIWKFSSFNQKAAYG